MQGFGGPCCARILTSWFATKERGTYWGMWNIAHNLGGFGAPLLAGTAARYYGWKWGERFPALTYNHVLDSPVLRPACAHGDLSSLDHPAFCRQQCCVEDFSSRDWPWSCSSEGCKAVLRDPRCAPACAGMWAPGLVGVVVGAILLLVVRDSPESVGFPPVEVVEAAKQDDGQDAPKESLLSMLVNNVLRNPFIWGMALTYFFIYVVRQGVTSWFVFYLIKVGGAQPSFHSHTSHS